MAQVISVSPDFVGQGIKVNCRGRNAATQAPDISKKVQLQTAGKVNNQIIQKSHRTESESDWDSNYHSSDKSIGGTPSPGREKRSPAVLTVQDHREVSTPSSSENTSPTSSRTPSQTEAEPQRATMTPQRSPAESPQRESMSSTVPSAKDKWTIPESKTAPTEELERQRIALQRATERYSLLILIPSLMMLFLSPWLMLPIFTVPNPSTPAFVLALLIGTPLGLICLTCGCLLGNVVWYHDPETGKWRWFLHCGKRFRDHYWGDDLFHGFKKTLKKGSTSVV